MIGTRVRIPRVRWKRNLLMVSIGCFVVQASYTVVSPFLPIFVQQLGTATDVSLWSGLLFSASFLASAIMAPVWGSLSDRYGKRIMLVRAGFAIAATYALTALATNHVQVLWLRVANGALSGYIPAATMLVAANTPDDELGFALGVLQTTVAVGTITGPLFGGLMAEAFGVRGAFIGCAALPAAASVLALAGIREDRIRRTEPTSVLRDVAAVLSTPALQALFAILLVTQAGALVVQPTLPLLIAELAGGNAPLATGVVFSLFGVSTALAAPIVARRKNANYTAMLVYSLLMSALLSALQGVARSIAGLGALRFVFGVPGAALSVAINVLVARSVTPETRGRAFGVMSGVSSGGAVLGPLIGGVLGGRLGVRSSFFGCASLYAAAAAVAAVSRRLMTDPGADGARGHGERRGQRHDQDRDRDRDQDRDQGQGQGPTASRDGNAMEKAHT